MYLRLFQSLLGLQNLLKQKHKFEKSIKSECMTFQFKKKNSPLRLTCGDSVSPELFDTELFSSESEFFLVFGTYAVPFNIFYVIRKSTLIKRRTLTLRLVFIKEFSRRL
jgi:hypothetical protein